MLFKYFVEKGTDICVAINPNKVKCIVDLPEGTKVVFENDTNITVTENYLNTATRLSEQ